MKVQLEIPDNIVQVRDTSNQKGVPITVLSIFGEDVAYYVGKSDSDFSCFDNSDWEDVVKHRMAKFFGKMIVNEFPGEWSENNPTGREISDSDRVIYLIQDKDE